MNNSIEKEILSSSSGWVAVILNLIPGLGTGYIYQRRWKAYWLTIIFSFIWILTCLYMVLSIDPSDPAIFSGDFYRVFGLFAIAIFTSIEAGIKLKSSRKVKS